MTKQFLNKVFKLSIKDVKEVMCAEDYEGMREISNPTQKLILDTIASQIMKEMEVA